MLGLGVLLWFAQAVAETDLQKGMAFARLIGAAAGLIVPALELTTCTLRSNWRLSMLIYASLRVAKVYLVFQNPKKLTQGQCYNLMYPCRTGADVML